MIITLLALLCSGDLCQEKIAGQNPEASLMSCWLQSQAIIADWKGRNPAYANWDVKSYRCVSGEFTLRRQI